VTRPVRHIPLEDFTKDPGAVFHQTVAGGTSVIVEAPGGARAMLSPIPDRTSPKARRAISDADFEAFLASAGSWSEVDTEALKRAIEESRNLATRLPPDL